MPEGELFENAEPVVIEEDSLKKLSSLCLTFKSLERDIELMEGKLKEKKTALEEVSRIEIPSILNTVGVSEVRLSTGEKLVVSDQIKPSIVNKNYMLAYQNMITAEGGDETAEEIVEDLFKSRVVLESMEDSVLDLLLEHEIGYDVTRTIHHQTLKKYCRGKLDQGEPIPEGITVFEYQETKIKEGESQWLKKL